MKEASIIISNKNRIELLKNCLKSIEKYTKDVDYNLYIIDSNSTDGSIDFIKNEYSNKANLIFENKPSTYAESNNRVMRICNTPYIYLLNNDCLVSNKWLRNAIDFANNDNQIGHVASLVLWENNKVQSHGANITKEGNTNCCFQGLDKNDDNLKNVRNYAYAGLGLYRKDLLEQYNYMPEYPSKIYWSDSISGNRYTVIKYKNNIQIINFSDLFNRYNLLLEYIEDREIIDLEKYNIEIYTLSSDKIISNNVDKINYKSILTSYQLECLNKSNELTQSEKYTKKRAQDILNNGVICGKWKRINKIIRHKTDKKLFRVGCAKGETIVTKDHSLIIRKENNLIPNNLDNIDNQNLAKIQTPPEVINYCNIDLKDYLINDNFIFDDNFIYSKNTNKSWRNFKFYRFINGGKLEDLMLLLGSYISEGYTSLTKYNYKISGICNYDISWLEKIKLALERLTIGLKFYISKDRKCYKLMSNSSLIHDILQSLCGKYSNHKKIPNFIFNLDNTYKKILLDNMILGDGYIPKKGTKKYNQIKKRRFNDYFQYTTNSLELISDLSFLLLQLEIRFSIYHRKSNNSYQLISKYSHRYVNNGFLNIQEECITDGYVYDLSVEDSNMFTDACGNILLHNTGWGMRLWENGYNVRYCPSSIVYHLLHKSERNGHYNDVNTGRIAFMNEYSEFLKENNGFFPDYPFTGKRPYRNTK